jgi:hypothetical protein
VRTNPQKIKKRTPTEVRAFVKKRCEAENLRMMGAPGYGASVARSTGSRATGPDLLRAAEAIALLPNKLDQDRIVATFGTLTKYQALQVLLNGEVGKRFPEVAEKIADAISEVDYIADFVPPR